jgi:hypothetical protein
LENALFTANNVILRLVFAQDQNFTKIHKTDKIIVLANTKKNACLMVLNEKPNCQVSRILMNPGSIFSDRSENDPDVSFFDENSHLCQFSEKSKKFGLEKGIFCNA